MAVLRLSGRVHEEVHDHLFSRPGEHFAFFLARASSSGGEPVFIADIATLIPDEHVRHDKHGWEIDPDYLLDVVNDAIRSGHALIEAHNHGGHMPRPSRLDRVQYGEFVPYILDSLGGRPYAATVWGDSTIYGEFFSYDGTGPLRSITVSGTRLRQLVSCDDDTLPPEVRYDRQLPWFTAEGQRQLRRLRFGVVGAGGTGSHVALQLPYLGARDIVQIDHDIIDETSGNRTVTATPADTWTAKAIVARRTVKSIAPDAKHEILVADLRDQRALDALKGVDVILGCVDNDGARLILNELAVAYAIPYFDLAVGIDAEHGDLHQAGGRLAVVIPDGPCLLCMDEIDRAEARYHLSTPDQQAEQRRLGYVTGLDVPAPAVVSLNGIISSMALTEIALYLSGARPTNPLTVLDLLGIGQSTPAQWVTPLQVAANPSCLTCSFSRCADEVHIDRYALAKAVARDPAQPPS